MYDLKRSGRKLVLCVVRCDGSAGDFPFDDTTYLWLGDDFAFGVYESGPEIEYHI